MNKTDETRTVNVVKTDQLNQQKLRRIARRYGLRRHVIRELQQGYSENVPRKAAEAMRKDGYVVFCDPKPVQVEDMTTEDVTPTATTEDNRTNETFVDMFIDDKEGNQWQ